MDRDVVDEIEEVLRHGNSPAAKEGTFGKASETGPVEEGQPKGGRHHALRVAGSVAGSAE
jgi:hypothetical protein